MPLGLYPNSPDLNVTWARLEQGVDHLLDHLETPLQPGEYMGLYTYTHTLFLSLFVLMRWLMVT